MWRRTTLDAVLGIVVSLATAFPAAGRGRLPGEDPWNPSHIAGLPREIRAEVARWQQACGAPLAALHYFSRRIRDGTSGDRFIALHFDELECHNRAAICMAEGCLHQVYVSNGGAYRRVLNIHASEIELKLLNNRAAVEIACYRSIAPCVRLLRWDGAHFIPQRN
jgi:hypothetical protein